MMERFYIGVSNIVAISHMWLFSLWHVASVTEEMNFTIIKKQLI